MFEMCAWDVSLRWEWGVVGGRDGVGVEEINKYRDRLCVIVCMFIEWRG